eukprot:scaffold152139_cov18-Tisochrysis_lutea.AAC.1
MACPVLTACKTKDRVLKDVVGLCSVFYVTNNACISTFPITHLLAGNFVLLPIKCKPLCFTKAQLTVPEAPAVVLPYKQEGNTCKP